MSQSKECLQMCLDKLEVYCQKWKLDINIKKTKVVLFNKQGSLIKKHNFYLNINNIESVKEYKYKSKCT